MQNISNAILIEKLKRFFNNVGYAKSEWESFANKNLNPDSPSYAETMKRIVYVIDSISDERKIDVYANITRAYMEDKLTEDVFFELSEIIGSLPYNKMMSLKLFCTGSIVGRNNNMIILQTYDLIKCNNEGTWIAVDPLHMEFAPTALGDALIEYGLGKAKG